MRITTLALLCLPLFAAEPSRLESEIARLSRITDGITGVSAIHLESGRRVDVRARDRYPMASTFKIPIAVQLLAKVDRGEVRLDTMVTIEPRDLHPGSGTLSNLFNKPGVALSVRNLMELMLLISDNSATDVCLRLAGGAKAVTAKMKDLDIDGIDVSRSTAQLISDWIGIEKLPPESEWTPETFGRLYRDVTPEARKSAGERFDSDTRDTATPAGMVTLLEKIANKKLHKPASAELLLDIMDRCQTGDARLKGMLPPRTAVAHKTGTIGGSTNDAGIITLPDGAGRIAIAVFVKSAKNPTETSEKAIAQITRSVYDYFLYSH